MKEARKVAVIGTKIQEVLFAPGEDPIGETIRAGNAIFQVVGVLDTTGFGPGGQQRDFFNSRIFVPRPALARILGMGDRITTIPILLDSTRPSIEVGERRQGPAARPATASPPTTNGPSWASTGTRASSASRPCSSASAP